MCFPHVSLFALLNNTVKIDILSGEILLLVSIGERGVEYLIVALASTPAASEHVHATVKGINFLFLRLLLLLDRGSSYLRPYTYVHQGI
jgi:hypothetical protein